MVVMPDALMLRNNGQHSQQKQSRLEMQQACMQKAGIAQIEWAIQVQEWVLSQEIMQPGRGHSKAWASDSAHEC